MRSPVFFGRTSARRLAGGALILWSLNGCQAGAADGIGGAGGLGAGGKSSGTTLAGSPDASSASFSTGTNQETTSGGLGGGCAESKFTAQKVPLDMYIMLDHSASMEDNGKWGSVTSALDTFVDDPSEAGLGVGIQFFGIAKGPTCPVFCQMDSDCGACGPCFIGACIGSNDSCDATDYATPAVEIADLPGAAGGITSAIAAKNPDGDSTPTSAALTGALDHAEKWATAHPDHVVIVVLATDGDPTSCDTNLSDIDGYAAAGYGSKPSVRTFVIGVGDSTDALNGIAAAGGTTKAYLVDANASATDEFIKALNDIQGQLLQCTYTIPVPTSGTPDFTLVNVKYTPSAGSPEYIPNVADAASCPASGDAWYYDDPSAPKQIILCGTICNTVKADTAALIQVVLGCSTIPA